MESPCSTARLWVWNRRCLSEAPGVSSASLPLLLACAGCLTEVPRAFSLVPYVALTKENPRKAKKGHFFYLFGVDKVEKVPTYLVTVTCQQISSSTAAWTTTVSECGVWNLVEGGIQDSGSVRWTHIPNNTRAWIMEIKPSNLSMAILMLALHLGKKKRVS